MSEENVNSYPFVVSMGARDLISTLGLSHEEVMSIPREFNAGGCHTFLLRSDIVREEGKSVKRLQFTRKPPNWGKKKYGRV